MQWERKHIRMAKLIIIEVWRMWNIVWRDNRVQFPQQKMSLSYSLLNNTMSWRSQLLLTSISTQAIIICCTYSTLTQWQAAFVSRFPLFDFCHSSCCCCCYCMLLYRSCKMIRLKLIQCSNFNKSCFFGNFFFPNRLFNFFWTCCRRRRHHPSVLLRFFFFSQCHRVGFPSKVFVYAL